MARYPRSLWGTKLVQCFACEFTFWENRKSAHRNTPTWAPIHPSTGLTEINRWKQTSEGINTITVIVQMFGRLFWYKIFKKLTTKPLWITFRSSAFFACFLKTTAIVELSLIKNIYSFDFHHLFLCYFVFSHLCPMYDSVEAQSGLAFILHTASVTKEAVF